MLEKFGVEVTPNRVKIFEIIGNNNFPLSASEVFDIVSRTININRVTVYRVLNLLVERGLVDRISAGDRSHRYGIAPNSHHLPHAHFYCRQCGNMECLNPGTFELDLDRLNRTFPGVIEKIEVRLDGTCKNCLKHSPETGKSVKAG